MSQLPEFWDQRYQKEGAIWGNGSSLTQQLLLKNLPVTARVFETGFGYGRDLLDALRQGYAVDGIEISREGLAQTQHAIETGEFAGKSTLYLGDMSAGPELPHNTYDAIYSHRVLHLLPTEEGLAAFAKKAADIAKKGAKICIGARDMRDLDPEKVILHGDNLIEVRARPGHLIRCMDEKSFQKYFGAAFDVTDIAEAEEPDTMENGRVCYFSVMTAYRK